MRCREERLPVAAKVAQALGTILAGIIAFLYMVLVVRVRPWERARRGGEAGRLCELTY